MNNLYNDLSMQFHIKNLQNANNKENDISNAMEETHQQMQILDIVKQNQIQIDYKGIERAITKCLEKFFTK